MAGDCNDRADYESSARPNPSGGCALQWDVRMRMIHIRAVVREWFSPQFPYNRHVGGMDGTVKES